MTERPPEPETEVLAVCNRNGYIFVIPAIYEDGKMLTRDSAWNWSDIYCYGLYDEEADDYYIPEGWWENRKFNPDDVYNNPVDCAVTHWIPLPEAPEEIKAPFTEDTMINLEAQALGVEPSRLRELAEADKDGRLVVRMAELKPCPFCGGEAVATKHHNRFTEWYLCSCPKCHISQTGSEYGFRFEAVDAWNRRVNDG